MILPRYLSAATHLFDTSIYRHDGDSFLIGEFDLGFGVRLSTTSRYDRQIVRLIDVDCPEKNDAGGLEARAFTEQWMEEASQIEERFYLEVETIKRDAFGRWLAYVKRLKDGRYLHYDLIYNGHDTGKRW